MQCCEIKSNSACRREPSSLAAEPLRVAKQTAGAVHLQIVLAFRSLRKTLGWRSLPPARRVCQSQVRMASGIQIPTTIWRLPCILPAGPASEPKMKATMVKAMEALLQSSPAPTGRARPNHSVNLRANGIARCPAAAHSAALHSAAAGHRAMPLAPGYLER
jgi:hypothetical protein